MTTSRILLGLVALLALTGLATAQDAEIGDCPECDADGEPGTNSSYSSLDHGLITDVGGYLVDTDLSVADEDHPDGFWFWFQLCISAFVDCIEQIVGFDTGFDYTYEIYSGEQGTDIDSTLTILGESVSLDDTPAGDVDDMTWEVMDDAGAAELVDAPVGGEMVPEDIDEDACLYVDTGLAPC